MKATTIKEWILTNCVPDFEVGIIMDHYSAALEADLPEEEWLIAFDLSDNDLKRTRIYHQAEPRFTARAVACDDRSFPLQDKAEVDLTIQPNYRGRDDVVICEVGFDDPIGSAPKARCWYEPTN